MADISGITIPTVDTSSYKNVLPTGQSTALETAAQLGAMEQQKTAIDQQKFNLAKDKWGAINRELGILANDKNVTRDKVVNKVNMISKVFGIPKEQFDEFMKDVPNDPDGIRRTITDAMLRGASVMEQMEYHLGKINVRDFGGQYVTTRESPKFGVIPTGQQFPKTLPQTTEEYRGEGAEGERPQFRGPQPYPGIPVAPPGPVQRGAPLGAPTGGSEAPQMSVGAPQAAPGGLPVASSPPTAAPTGSPPRASVSEPVYAAPPVMLGESKKAYTEDQALATQKMTAIKPALQALKLAKQGVKSGPGTSEFNEFVAGLKAFGIMPTQIDDPTVAYQEMNKALNQYIQRSGSRSDADLASKEMANPNIKTQINPALIKILQSAIAQDRIEAARSGAYDTKQGMSKYIEHRGTFPQKMNMDAAEFDMIDDPKEKEKIYNEYKAKYKKGDTNAIKFFNTLKLMRQLEMHEDRR